MVYGNLRNPGSHTLGQAMKGTMFVGNMLYLGVTSQILSLFACNTLKPGSYYLVAAPYITCYEGASCVLLTLTLIVTLIITKECSTLTLIMALALTLTVVTLPKL